MRKTWSQDEISFLKELYEHKGLGASELYEEFSMRYPRTIISVEVKIRKLKLKHTKPQLSAIKSRLTSGSRNGMFGKSSAMKGLTKETSDVMKTKSERTSQTRLKMFKDGRLKRAKGKSNPMYGKKSWCKGLTKYTNGTLAMAGLKISKLRTEYWNSRSEEERRDIVDKLNRGMINSRSGTTIENRIEEVLNDFKTDVVKNKRIGMFYVDFFLPDYNMAIECDGDYWHANPMFYKSEYLSETQRRNVDRDERKNLMLKQMGIDLLRFWEHDILLNLNDIKQTLWERLQKKWMRP